MKKNLVLTGMMGVGKSTVGKGMAKKLSYDFIDIDKLIETNEKATINNIFKNKGEDYFRKIETKTTLQELKRKNSIISLGGGAFLSKLIRKAVKNSSISFWLDIDIDILVSRLNKSKKRPLLYEKDLNETVNKIYSLRKKSYNEADFKIKCNHLSTNEIINMILKIYEK